MFQSNILTGYSRRDEVDSSAQASTKDGAQQAPTQHFPPASKEGLGLATSLQLKANGPGILIFSGTQPGFPVTSLVKDLGKSLVELGASDVLLLDFSGQEFDNDVHVRSQLERILSVGSKLEDMFEQVLPGLYVLASHSISTEPPRPGSEDVKSVFNNLRRRFRYVLIATSTYRQDNTARLLARHAEGIILGIQQGQQGRGYLRQIQRDLISDGSISLGFIFSNGPQK